MKIQAKLDLHSIPYELTSGHIYVQYNGVEYYAHPDKSEYLTKHLKSSRGPRLLDVSVNGHLTPIADSHGLDAYVWAELTDRRKS